MVAAYTWKLRIEARASSALNLIGKTNAVVERYYEKPFIEPICRVFERYALTGQKHGQTVQDSCCAMVVGRAARALFTGNTCFNSYLYCDINLDRWHLLLLKDKTIRLTYPLKICFLLRIICF